MAAHSLRILMEMGGVDKLTDELRDYFSTALDCAPGMDELDMGDWRRLKEALKNPEVGAFDFQDIVMEVLAVQGTKWLAFDKPRDHEQWQKVKHLMFEDGTYWS